WEPEQQRYRLLPLFLGTGARVGLQPSCSSPAVPVLDDAVAVGAGVQPRLEALVAAKQPHRISGWCSLLRRLRRAPPTASGRAATSTSRTVGSIDSATADACAASGAGAGCARCPFPWYSSPPPYLTCSSTTSYSLAVPDGLSATKLVDGGWTGSWWVG
uniref:Uncharacterized protein n=1 Tax=Triticum urartu TaxID=4572 RepID=A0A8R7TL58_TRIUA